jgi:branched-chain amino acid transport system ATP-binding protein
VSELRQPILVVEGLVAGYEPGLPIVNGVSISADAAEIVVLLGPNGAGKSTLIKAVAGLVPIGGGTVSLAGKDITRLPAHQIVRNGLAFAPQTENVFASMSVDDNLRLASGILAASLRGGRIAEMYSFFPDLARQRNLLAGRLSGGQRQMLAIARALLVGPSVLLLDEPSAGLSPKLVDGVFARLIDIRATGVAIVLVEQNARAALAIADRAYIMAEGRNRHEGSAASLANDPAVAALYLGGLRGSPARGAAS